MHTDDAITHTYTLCHQDECCPTVEVGPEGVRLRDDLGGEVQLTTGEWNDLVERVRKGEIG